MLKFDLACLAVKPPTCITFNIPVNAIAELTHHTMRKHFLVKGIAK